MSASSKKTYNFNKAATATNSDPGLLLSNLIDEIATMQVVAEAKIKRLKQLQSELKPFNERVKQLATLITSMAEEQGLHPDQEFTMDTLLAHVDVGRRGNERRVVSLELALKRMGKAVFFEKATLGLAICDQYLTPEQKVGVVETTRVVRSIKVALRISGPTLH